VVQAAQAVVELEDKITFPGLLEQLIGVAVAVAAAKVSSAVQADQASLLFATLTVLPQLQPLQVPQQSRCLVVTGLINGLVPAQ